MRLIKAVERVSGKTWVNARHGGSETRSALKRAVLGLG